MKELNYFRIPSYMFECAFESSLKCHDHKSKNTTLLTLPGPYHVETNPLICKENGLVSI